MTYQHWLYAAVALVILEILPPATHFVCLGLALGALAAAIASYLGVPDWLAWVVFIGASAASMPVLVPLAKFLFQRRNQDATEPSSGTKQP